MVFQNLHTQAGAFAPEPDSHELTLGDVTVTRIKEHYGSVEMTPEQFFPDSSPLQWSEHESWIAPDFWDPASNECYSSIQTWLLRSEGRVILVDTGVGEDKERPYAPVWSRRSSQYLENLAAAGVRPDDVDLVINTHLHVDHVGWNTVLQDRKWVPTFPNATYLMPKADFEFWNPVNENTARLGRGNQNVFEDSVAPVFEAGQVQLWDESFRVDANLRLDPAPGHTPGSSVLSLESGNDRALFVGDLVHTVLQIVDPEINSCFCEDEGDARATRRRLLGRAAETNALVFPAHLGGAGAVQVGSQGAGFAIREWAPFATIS